MPWGSTNETEIRPIVVQIGRWAGNSQERVPGTSNFVEATMACGAKACFERCHLAVRDIAKLVTEIGVILSRFEVQVLLIPAMLFEQAPINFGAQQFQLTWPGMEIRKLAGRWHGQWFSVGG